MSEVTREDIERYYAKAAASGVYAPLDPGELDTMEDRLAGRVVWREPDRNAVHHINLTARWLGVALTDPWRGAAVELEPGEYQVLLFGPSYFIVRGQVVAEVALVHSL